MSELSIKVNEAIKNNVLLNREDFPDKIHLNDYYAIFKEALIESKRHKNSIQEIYCAIYLQEYYVLLRSLISFDETMIEKDVYHEVGKLLEKKKQKESSYYVKSTLLCLFLTISIYYLVSKVLMMNVIIAVVLAFAFLFIDLYFINKTNHKHYERKWQKEIKKSVNANLLMLNDIYLE